MQRLRLGDVDVDLEDGHVRRGAVVQSTLTATEMALLRFLASHRGQPISKASLLETVWGYASSARSRTVDTTVARLRGKIEAVPRRPVFLQTVHGVGLMLAAEATVDDPERVHERAWCRLETAVAEGVRCLVLTGPPGVGKSHMARALMDKHGGGPSLAASTALPPEPDTPWVHLDNTEGLGAGYDAQIRSWTPRRRVVMTQRGGRVPPGSTRIRLAPLGVESARCMLHDELRRLDTPASAESVARVVDGLDGLPSQLVLAAQRFERLRTPEDLARLRREACRASVLRGLDELDAVDGDALRSVAWFRGWFTVADAEELDPTVDGARLDALCDAGWLRFHEGRASLVRGIREGIREAPDPQEERRCEAWLNWVSSRRMALWRDGIDTLEGQLDDLREALAVDPDMARTERTVDVWMCLAVLLGPIRSFIPPLHQAAARFPESRLLQLQLVLARGLCGRLPEEALEPWVDAPEVEAAILHLYQASLRGSAELVELRQTVIDKVQQGSVHVQAAYLPQLFSRSPPEAYDQALHALTAHAYGEGWSFISQHIERHRLESLVRAGHYRSALTPAARWPHEGALLGADTALFLGVAAFMLSDFPAARAWFAAMAERRVADASMSEILTGVVDVAMGQHESALHRLLLCQDGSLPEGAYIELAVAVLHVLELGGVRHPRVEAMARMVDGERPTDAPVAIPTRVLWHLLQTRV